MHNCVDRSNSDFGSAIKKKYPQPDLIFLLHSWSPDFQIKMLLLLWNVSELYDFL